MGLRIPAAVCSCSLLLFCLGWDTRLCLDSFCTNSASASRCNQDLTDCQIPVKNPVLRIQEVQAPFSDVLHNNQTDYSLNETLVWRNYFPRPFQLVAVCVEILFLKLQSAAPNDLAIFSLKATIVLFIWDFK